MTKRLRKAFALLAAGFLIGAAWFVYALWGAPGSSGLEVKDGALLSIIPTGLSLVLLVWGLVRVVQAIWSRDGRRR